MAGPKSALQLFNNRLVMEVIAAGGVTVIPKPDDLRRVRHDRELCSKLIKERQQPIGWFDDQFAGTAVAVPVNFVIEREDQSQHNEASANPKQNTTPHRSGSTAPPALVAPSRSEARPLASRRASRMRPAV